MDIEKNADEVVQPQTNQSASTSIPTLDLTTDDAAPPPAEPPNTAACSKASDNENKSINVQQLLDDMIDFDFSTTDLLSARNNIEAGNLAATMDKNLAEIISLLDENEALNVKPDAAVSITLSDSDDEVSQNNDIDESQASAATMNQTINTAEIPLEAVLPVERNISVKKNINNADDEEDIIMLDEDSNKPKNGVLNVAEKIVLKDKASSLGLDICEEVIMLDADNSTPSTDNQFDEKLTEVLNVADKTVPKDKPSSSGLDICEEVIMLDADNTTPSTDNPVDEKLSSASKGLPKSDALSSPQANSVGGIITLDEDNSTASTDIHVYEKPLSLPEDVLKTDDASKSSLATTVSSIVVASTTTISDEIISLDEDNSVASNDKPAHERPLDVSKDVPTTSETSSSSQAKSEPTVLMASTKPIIDEIIMLDEDPKNKTPISESSPNNESIKIDANTTNSDAVNIPTAPKTVGNSTHECINCECAKQSTEYSKADAWVLNHFNIPRKLNRQQFVCLPCQNDAIHKYSELCGLLVDHQPLLLEPIAKRPVLVEIIDSSDEEDDAAAQQSAQNRTPSTDVVPAAVLKLLETDFESVLAETLQRVQIEQQMIWTTAILRGKMQHNKVRTHDIAAELQSLQKLADGMSKRLYQTTGCAIKTLPPFDLNTNQPMLIYGPDNPPEGAIELPEVNTSQLYYAVRHKLMAAWMTCKVIEIMEATPLKRKQYKVRYTRNKGINNKIVNGSQIAYSEHPNVRLKEGTRVIALFHQEETNQRTHYYPGVIAEPLQLYNQWRYLVFFDDGYAQYVTPDNVRLVCEASANVWQDVHPASSLFIKNYLNQYRSQRPMVQVKTGQRMVTEWHGKWLPARVQQIDASLVQMFFDEGKRTEWIYRGSTRLSPLFSKHVQKHSGGGLNKRNEPYVEYISVDSANRIHVPKEAEGPSSAPPRLVSNEKPFVAPPKPRTNVAKKSTSSSATASSNTASVAAAPPVARLPPVVPTIQHMNNSTIYVDEDNRPKGKVVYYTAKKHMPPRRYTAHDCSPKCLYDVKHNLSSYSPLAKPLLSGWERQICKGKTKKVVMYRAPCGIRLRNMPELHRYLRLTQCSLNVDNFDFDFLIHCLAEYVIDSCIVQKADLSDGREQMVVPSVNYYDNSTPPPCIYSEKRIPNEGVPLNLDPEFLCGCDCDDDCMDKSKCQCWQLTLDGARYNNHNVQADEVGYEFKRLPDSVPTGIYECNSRCKCSRSCMNRVAQQPLQLKLQVFKTGNRGWGLRCLNDVPKGSFVCVYAGDLMTEQNANEAGDNFGDEYFAELDYIEVVESLKEGYEPEAAKESDDCDEDDDYRRDDDSQDEEFVERNTSEHSKQTRYNTRTRHVGEAKANAPAAPAVGPGAASQRKDDDGSDYEEERQQISFVPDANTEELATPKFKSIRKAFGKEEAVYIMDAKKTGNIGRYFNHSCAPNLFVQNVFVDTHDLRFPWVAFFALSHIRAGTELTWNYNYDVGSVPGKVLYCECGADTCRGRLL